MLASSRELDLVSNAKKIFFGLEMSFFRTKGGLAKLLFTGTPR